MRSVVPGYICFRKPIPLRSESRSPEWLGSDLGAFASASQNKECVSNKTPSSEGKQKKKKYLKEASTRGGLDHNHQPTGDGRLPPNRKTDTL